MEPSETKVMVPIWPNELTWVPPQNSNESGPACTTRTVSPYLSPKNAMAPIFSASALVASVVTTGSSVSTAALAKAKTCASSFLVGAAWWEKSKRSRSGATSEPCWRTWSPRTLAQRPVQEVGAGVVAAQRLAPLAVDGGQSRPGRPGSRPLIRARWAVRPGKAETVS